MSKLKESDYYYGAVLSTLLNNKICPVLFESGNDRQIYDCTTDHGNFRLFLKYRSTANTTLTPNYYSWQFVFSKKDLVELKAYLNEKEHLSLVLGLICGHTHMAKSHYAVVPEDVIHTILDQGKNSVTISWKKGEQYYRLISDGSRNNAIRLKVNAYC